MRPSLSWTIPYPHAAVPGSMPRTFTCRGYGALSDGSPIISQGGIPHERDPSARALACGESTIPGGARFADATDSLPREGNSWFPREPPPQEATASSTASGMSKFA